MFEPTTPLLNIQSICSLLIDDIDASLRKKSEIVSQHSEKHSENIQYLIMKIPQN